MRKYTISFFIAAFGTVMPALAHHSFSAEFDGSKTMVVKGGE
jgi:hypothetical protein